MDTTEGTEADITARVGNATTALIYTAPESLEGKQVISGNKA